MYISGDTDSLILSLTRGNRLSDNVHFTQRAYFQDKAALYLDQHDGPEKTNLFSTHLLQGKLGLEKSGTAIRIFLEKSYITLDEHHARSLKFRSLPASCLDPEIFHFFHPDTLLPFYFTDECMNDDANDLASLRRVQFLNLQSRSGRKTGMNIVEKLRDFSILISLKQRRLNHLRLDTSTMNLRRLANMISFYSDSFFHFLDTVPSCNDYRIILPLNPTKNAKPWASLLKQCHYTSKRYGRSSHLLNRGVSLGKVTNLF